MKSFDEWIEAVENGEVTGPGLLAASLDFRSSLRLAYKAGWVAGRNLDDIDPQEGHPSYDG